MTQFHLNQKKIVFCLMGPTASGKTQLALELVQFLPCEIISVDSAMIYRGMDIGTAKPYKHIREIAPHHLIDICDTSENYSVAQFRQDALEKIDEIIARQRIPLLVGGTMLYFHVLQQGLSELPAANDEVRKTIMCDAHRSGWEKLHEYLRQIDPLAAQRIHPHDKQRLQRALEVHRLTGKKITQLQDENKSQPLDLHFLNIAIMPRDRTELHRRIAVRFETMLQKGFLEEVTTLFQRGDLTKDMPSMRSVGYRQAWEFLEEQYDYENFCSRAIAATRQFAKRQLTWLRHWKTPIDWFNSEDKQLLEKITILINGRMV